MALKTDRRLTQSCYQDLLKLVVALRENSNPVSGTRTESVIKVRIHLDNIVQQFVRRRRQLRHLLIEEGFRGLVERSKSKAAERLAPKMAASPVRRADVLAADLSRLQPAAMSDHQPGEPITVNWVIVPAGPKSGGHTTIFRIIRYLHALGYRNRLYFYNVYGGDTKYYAAIAKEFYGFQGPIRSLDDAEMEDAHAVVATAWSTAYPVFNSRCLGKRFYFVQDYEPHFHPVGAVSLFAENTYRMGFHAITAGRWLAQKLRTEFAMEADSFDFGCDSSAYHLLRDVKRNGIVFYARPEAARRGFELGLMALEWFASRNPEIDIHFYGERIGNLPFRGIEHGSVTPDQLNKIYNQCYAGLSLSLTNVSLVPHEMLAAGCIPVVNEAPQNRLVLDNPFVRYAQPYPQALAAELEALLLDPDFDALSNAAATSVQGTSWDEAGATVDAIFRKAIIHAREEPCFGAAASPE